MLEAYTLILPVFLESDTRRTGSVGVLHVPHFTSISLWRMCSRISGLVEKVSSSGSCRAYFTAHSVSHLLCSDGIASVCKSMVCFLVSILPAAKQDAHRLCAVHNEVNIRLGKPVFDCSKLDSEYDCGCGDASSTSTVTTPAQATSSSDVVTVEPMDLERDVARDDMTGVRVIKGGRR